MKLKALILFLYLATAYTVAFAQEIPLQFAQPKGTPYLESQLINADSNEYNTVLLRIKAEQNGMAQLFWATSYDPQFNQYKTVAFPLKRGIHKYTINVPSQNPNWIGWVRKIILLPNAPIELRSAKVIKGNLFTNIASGWQELFLFEATQLRSVNFIYGPKINGKSVNLYIYCLIIFLSILIVIYQFTKSRNFNLSFKQSGKKIIIVCLFFWMLLDARILIDQAKTVKLDKQTFANKNLEEKRELLTLEGYYGFLKFAESKLPPGSGFNLLHPANYYYMPKANYYLYPIHFDEQADYLLVYDPNQTLNKQASEYRKKGYKLFATHKKGEYILKK